MIPMESGFSMLQNPEVSNQTTGPLIAGFVAGCAISLALIGLFSKMND